MKPLRVGFIGAGRRALSAHYPCVNRLEGVSIEAVADLDVERLKQVTEKYHVPHTFHCTEPKGYLKMLESVELDAVYVIMQPQQVVEPAVECMNAGKHIFIEKPAGRSVADSRALLEAAIANNVFCMVGFQRRFGTTTVEAMRRVKAHGPITSAMGEFHKGDGINKDLEDRFWFDASHVVDLVRFMLGSDAAEVTAYQDADGTGRRNNFNGLIRFANRAVGIVTACRTSGGRCLRGELHGLGISCYMDIPDKLEIHETGSKPVVLTGAELTGVDAGDVDAYEGVLAMHRHFADCVRSGEVPNADIRDVIHTSILCERLCEPA